MAADQENRLRWAMACFTDGRTDRARDLLSEWLAAHPADLFGCHLVLLAQGGQGLQGRREELISSLLRGVPLDALREARSSFVTGEALRQDGRVSEAHDQFRSAVARLGDEPAVHYCSSLCSMETGDFSEALSGLARALKLDAGFLPAARMLAVAALERGQLGAAHQVCESALGIPEQWHKGRFPHVGTTMREFRTVLECVDCIRTAVSLYERGEAVPAVGALLPVLRQAPRCLVAVRILVVALKDGGWLPFAASHLVAALVSEPIPRAYADALVSIYRADKEPAEILGLLQKVLEAAPDDPHVLCSRASVLEAQGDVAAAEQDLRVALAAYPRFLEARASLARLVGARGGFADVLHLAKIPAGDVEEAVSSGPNGTWAAECLLYWKLRAARRLGLSLGDEGLDCGEEVEVPSSRVCIERALASLREGDGERARHELLQAPRLDLGVLGTLEEEDYVALRSAMAGEGRLERRLEQCRQLALGITAPTAALAEDLRGPLGAVGSQLLEIYLDQLGGEGRWLDVIDLCGAALDEGHLEVLDRLCHAYLEEGDSRGLEELSARYPKEAEPLRAYLYLTGESHASEKAIEAAWQLLEIDPFNMAAVVFLTAHRDEGSVDMQRYLGAVSVACPWDVGTRSKAMMADLVAEDWSSLWSWLESATAQRDLGSAGILAFSLACQGRALPIEAERQLKRFVARGPDVELDSRHLIESLDCRLPQSFDGLLEGRAHLETWASQRLHEYQKRESWVDMGGLMVRLWERSPLSENRWD